jgi:ABC-2 type transport system ATP-binding protein
MSVSLHHLASFLPGIENILDDMDVSELMINGPGNVWVERSGAGLAAIEAPELNAAALHRAAIHIARPLGLDPEAVPIIDARLEDGSRVAICVSPATPYTAITIRRFGSRRFTAADLVELGSLTPGQVELIRATLLGRKNILVSGGTGSGKTTLLNALIELLPLDDRIVAIEDTLELSISHQNCVRFEARELGEGSVTIRDLVKHYVVPERAGGLRASFRSVFRRKHRLVRAVDGISFEVDRGEVVGFLGPNGAGKTTALKVLSGLLHPTDGQVDVLGFTPWDRRAEYLSRITLIMGQRQQLFWDLPAADSFLVNKAVFGIDDATYKRTVDLLTELLDLGDLLTKPVRQLSLGERMKVELAAGLLHTPRVLFLDEPTIGLDVTMQQRIREFVTAYNAETGATVLLTSHYMADVKALARRVIVIDKGQLLYDGALDGLVQRYAPHKTITVHLERPVELPDLNGQAEVLSVEGLRVTVRAGKDDAPGVTGRLLTQLPIADLSVEDPPLEEVIDQVFRGEGP